MLMLEGLLPAPPSPRLPKRSARIQPGSETPHAAEFISVRDIAGFIGKYRWTLAAPVLFAVFLAGLYILIAAPTFTARSQLLIDPKTPILREQTGEVNFSLDAAQVESHIAVLRSEKIALNVIKGLGLEDDPDFRHGHGAFARLLSFAGLKGGDATNNSGYFRERSTIAAFATRLSVHRIGLSYAIEISFSSTSPDRAAQVVNAVAGAYVNDQLESKSEAARQGSDWLEERIAGLRRQMNGATKKVQAFRAKHDYRIPDVVQSQKPRTAADFEETLEELEATAETYRKIYESFLQAYTTSVLRQSYPVSDARIITPATPPLHKSHPRSSLVLALGVLLGLMTGVGAAIVRHSFSDSIIHLSAHRDENRSSTATASSASLPTEEVAGTHFEEQHSTPSPPGSARQTADDC